VTPKDLVQLNLTKPYSKPYHLINNSNDYQFQRSLTLVDDDYDNVISCTTARRGLQEATGATIMSLDI